MIGWSVLIKPGMCRPVADARLDFFKIDPVWIVSMCVCLCVCPPLRLSITSGVMWRDMNSVLLVKQVL